MPHLTHSEISKHSSKQIFDLVAKIEEYPEFLPWCSGARIKKQVSETELMAELVISFKGLSERYTSKVTLTPYNSIKSELVEGPFKHLINEWEFREDKNGETEIELKLDFQFKSSLLDKMIGGVFAKASEKMISAFRERADELYS